MKRCFWEAAAAKWEAEIFDTLSEDRHQVIRTAIRELGSRNGTVADYGCGIGRYLPLLADSFGKVIGLDWAAACVERARARVETRGNVDVYRSTSKAIAGLHERCDVTLAINVAIDPRAQAWERTLRQAISLTKPAGRLVLVVPSLESVAYACLVRRTLRPASHPIYGARDAACGKHGPGIVTIEGQPTKHFAGDELLFLLRSLGCQPGNLQRVEYAWSSQDFSAPQRIREAGPWDWLVVARKA